MALNLANVETTDTFQTWYTRTNEILRDAFPTSGGTITGNLVVSGNASFVGNTTLLSVTELTARDAILHLGANNPSDIIDLGVVGTYVRGDGQNTHTGFIRDSGTKEIYFIDEAGTGQAGQPFNSFNPNAADTVLANVHVRKLTGTTASLSGSVSASAFVGDGSQLTNAGSTVAVDGGANRDLSVPFTGITTGTMTSANVASSLTFNPSTGTLSATAFVGDGSQLTNAGSAVSTDSVNHTLFVPFTGISSGTMTSANVNSSFTFNPSTGLLESTKVKTSDLQDSSGRTLTIRDESGTIVWGG